MAETYRRQSPLAHMRLEARALGPVKSAGVRLGEAKFRGQLALRGDAKSETFKDMVKEVFGVALPVEPNTVSEKNRRRYLLWLGPDEWLAVVPDAREAESVAAFHKAMEDEHYAITDVSASRCVITLSGKRARDVLMKGSSLDFHPRVFTAGRCAQTSIARCHMLIHQTTDAPAYDIYVHRSFADYLWRWLEDASREYGVQVVTGN